MTVSQISDYLGFSDATYFSRFFRRSTGFSPRDFRDKPTQTCAEPATRCSRAGPSLAGEAGTRQFAHQHGRQAAVDANLRTVDIARFFTQQE